MLRRLNCLSEIARAAWPDASGIHEKEVIDEPGHDDQKQEDPYPRGAAACGFDSNLSHSASVRMDQPQTSRVRSLVLQTGRHSEHPAAGDVADRLRLDRFRAELKV